MVKTITDTHSIKIEDTGLSNLCKPRSYIKDQDMRESEKEFMWAAQCESEPGGLYTRTF